ncbi:MAG: hypothetical protein LBG92_00930, partial [Prevotellaceae bacterium]|nr:hypothetical protein [Prevotellaceae bacterium]
YWEEEGIEVLSFKISLPEPNIVNDISKEELFEIVKRLKEGIFEENNKNKFIEEFNCHLGDYYHKLLEINFIGYTNEYFNRQKGKDGKYFEYTIEEIVEKIWNKEIK